MADPSRVRVAGPLAAFATGFSDELLRQGYTPDSACLQMRLMAHMSRWLSDEHLDTAALTADHAQRYLGTRRAAGYTSYLSHKAMRPVLGYLRKLGAAPPPPVDTPTGAVEVALERYGRHLIGERGLGRATVRGYVDAVRPFLSGRLSPDGHALDLEHLTSADVTAFVVTRCPQQTPSPAKLTVTALRSLLTFLYAEGTIGEALAAAVPAVARRRLARLPKGIDAAQVRCLLAACDRRTPNGRRAFAMITVLVRLGLRANELAVLRLDDIDWRAGDVVIHGKGNRAERLPLPADVGEAIAAYLRHDRPAKAEGRSVFVRAKAPLGPLTGAGVNQVVVAAARRAGLTHTHAHCCVTLRRR